MKFSSTPKTIGQQVSQTSISKSILPYSIAPNPSLSIPGQDQQNIQQA